MSQKFLKFTSESLSASYIPFPRFLMEDSLAELSNDAKVLYALMLDRASISKVNGFLETDGTIRMYFTVEQAQKKLRRSRQCTTKAKTAKRHLPNGKQRRRFRTPRLHKESGRIATIGNPPTFFVTSLQFLP